MARNRLVVPQAQAGMYDLKWEVASELGINIPNQDYWGDVSSKDCGSVGGNMVKKMVKSYQESLAQKS
jgi:hypothetical protein